MKWLQKKSPEDLRSALSLSKGSTGFHLVSCGQNESLVIMSSAFYSCIIVGLMNLIISMTSSGFVSNHSVPGELFVFLFLKVKIL